MWYLFFSESELFTEPNNRVDASGLIGFDLASLEANRPESTTQLHLPLQEDTHNSR